MEALGEPDPDALKEARQTCAVFAATMSEMLIISVLEDEKISKDAKKSKLQLGINRMTSQSKDLGHSVRDLCHDTLYETAMRFVFQ